MSSQVDPGYLQPPTLDVVDAVRRALDEDLTPLGDLTATLVPPVLGEARFVARTDGVLAGTACATETFAQLDAAVEVDWVRDDGARLSAGEVFGVVRGPFRSILTGERTALNFLGFLSGIATLTAAYVDAAAAGGDARVWDTRKTIPGLRSLSKAAVRAGGGRSSSPPSSACCRPRHASASPRCSAWRWACSAGASAPATRCSASPCRAAAWRCSTSSSISP